MDNQGAGRLFAAVYASGQSLRFAIHDPERTGRLRSLLRQLDSFSRALARREFQRRAAKGHAGRAVRAGQAGKLGRPDCTDDGGGDAAHPRPHESDLSRDRTVSAEIPGVALTWFTLQESCSSTS